MNQTSSPLGPASPFRPPSPAADRGAQKLTRTDELPGQQVDDGKGRIFPCEGCGADVTFHIGTQRLKCPYCGFQKQIELDPQARVSEQDFHAILVRVRELRDKGPPQEAGQSEVRCEACGGTVVFVGPLTSTECPYCATPIQRENVHTSVHRIPVDGVMPFQIDADVAKQNLVQWVRSRWFAPNDFSRQGVQGKFSGVYLPYWTYDTLTANRYRGERGEHYWVTVGSGKNRRTERRTRWYPASGSFQRFFDDVLVLASRGLNRKYALALEPWPLGLCVPFNQQMLAGFFSRTYEIDLDEGFHEAKARIDAAIADDVRARIGGDEQRIHWIDTQYHALTFKHLLLPAWLMAYRYRDKLYQVMVNAATGEVQGERPYSWIKITLAIVAGIAAAAGIVLAVHLAQS